MQVLDLKFVMYESYYEMRLCAAYHTFCCQISCKELL